MKVKELAIVLNVSAEELLELLENIDVDTSKGVETEVDKDLEKKLAKRYGVPYPFKTNNGKEEKEAKKNAPKSNITVKISTNQPNKEADKTQTEKSSSNKTETPKQQENKQPSQKAKQQENKQPSQNKASGKGKSQENKQSSKNKPSQPEVKSAPVAERVVEEPVVQQPVKTVKQEEKIEASIDNPIVSKYEDYFEEY